MEPPKAENFSTKDSFQFIPGQPPYNYKMAGPLYLDAWHTSCSSYVPPLTCTCLLFSVSNPRMHMWREGHKFIVYNTQLLVLNPNWAALQLYNTSKRRDIDNGSSLTTISH